MSTNIPISELCKSRKEELRITFKEIADATNLSERTVERYLNRGAFNGISIHTVGPICAFLGVSLDDYFDIPVEKDPRLEDVVEQMKIGIATRDETISRLREIVDEQEEKLREKDKAIKDSRLLLLHYTLAAVCIGVFLLVWAIWHCLTI